MDFVIVHKIDRLTRNRADGAAIHLDERAGHSAQLNQPGDLRRDLPRLRSDQTRAELNEPLRQHRQAEQRLRPPSRAASPTSDAHLIRATGWTPVETLRTPAKPIVKCISAGQGATTRPTPQAFVRRFGTPVGRSWVQFGKVQTLLTPGQVVELVDAYESGATTAELSKKPLGLPPHRRSAPSPSEHPLRRGGIAPEHVNEAAALYESGMSLATIAARFSTSAAHRSPHTPLTRCRNENAVAAHAGAWHLSYS